MQDTTRQHYVPRFYLRRFADAGQQLHRLDVARRSLSHVSPRSACQEDYFYGINTGTKDDVSQAFEGALGALEDQFAARLGAVEARLRIDKYLDSNGKAILADLMGMLYVRGTDMRKDMAQMASQLAKGTMRIVAGMKDVDDYIRKHRSTPERPLSDETVARAKAAMKAGEFNVSIDNSSHVIFQREMNGFANLLEGQQWTVFINVSGLPFVTTCGPLAEYAPADWKRGFLSPSFADCVHCFAVSSDTALIAQAPGGSDAATMVETLGLENRESVHELNFRLASNRPFVFAKDDEPLQRLLDGLRQE